MIFKMPLSMAILKFLNAAFNGKRFVGANIDQTADCLQRKVRVDRVDAVADQCGKMVDVARFRRLRHHAQPQSFIFSDEVVVNGAGREEHRQRNIMFIDAAVAQDDEVLSLRPRRARPLHTILPAFFPHRVIPLQPETTLKE